MEGHHTHVRGERGELAMKCAAIWGDWLVKSRFLYYSTEIHSLSLSMCIYIYKVDHFPKRGNHGRSWVFHIFLVKV